MNYSNDRQPRVLIVGSNKEFGGSLVSVCHTLCQGLVESNYEVFLLQPEGTLTNELGEVNISSDQINDITQLTISGWPSYLSQLMHHSDFKEGNQLFTEILKFVDPDIVHFHHTATFGSEIINIAKQQHCFVTVWLHDYWYFCPLMARVKSNGQSCNGSGEHCFECSCKQFTGLAENWKSRQQQSIKILNQCDRVIAVSQSIQSDAIRYGVDRHKITTIQPAVQSIDHLWDQLDYLQRPINESLLNFAFIGNLHSHKGIDVLFDALKLLQCKESQSIICHIHGTGEDAYVEQLKSSAETIYQTMIVFEGAYNANDDLPKILLETDLVILPSIKPESYGLIIEEVLAAKVPVICNQIGGFKEHFFNGVQGLLFEPNNVQALVNCLQSVVDNPLQLSAWQRNIRRPRLTQDFITEFDNLFRQLNQLSVIAPNKGSAESAKLLISPSNSSKTEQHYQSWRHFQQLNDADTLIMQQRMQQHWNQHPRFHLFLVMQVGDEKHLASTIESLANQFYKNFKLTVFSLLPCPDPVFDDMDSLQWQQLNEIDATQVSRFVMESTMDWIGLIESGDQLAQQSLFSLAEHINHQTN
ncbi:MAG: glycosyltransferase, partial [Methylococcales bacterium]|nr:glycosyltransferase [Methylococcales bacterium]